jgi:hypothetical protein
MKLTKGKILKLYNKKKQTLKKYKPNKCDNTSSKIKSFKNKKSINLANKSLKRINYKKNMVDNKNEESKLNETSKVEETNNSQIEERNDILVEPN